MDELKSMYLRNIDNLRVTAEYSPKFKLFFDTVCLFHSVALSRTRLEFRIR